MEVLNIVEKSTENLSEVNVIIVGSGISGNTLAIALKKKGYQVTVYEKGVSPDEILQGAGKSVNLAVSCRSLDYFADQNVQTPEMVPMLSRLIHLSDGSQLQRYNQFGERLMSINRNELNASLYESAKALGVEYHFQHELVDIDFSARQCHVKTGQNTITVNYDFLFGADGSNSCVAKCLDADWKMDPTKSVSQSDWTYQEYEINPEADQFALADPQNFHIWPGDKIFLIALPNANKTFTVTLFCHDDSDVNLQKIKEEGDLDSLQNIFSQLVHHQPLKLFNIEDNFRGNPVSSIYSRDSKHWHENAENPRVALIGDAPHAFEPFLGLGCNAGIEDVSILDHQWPQASNFDPNAISKIIKQFARARGIDTRALADASNDNAKVLSKGVADKDKLLKFLLTEHLERMNKKLFIDPHTMYSFDHMPESEARFRQLHQDAFLLRAVNFSGLRETFTKMQKVNFQQDALLDEALNSDATLKTNFSDYLKGSLAVYKAELNQWRHCHYPQLMFSPYHKPASPKVSAVAEKAKVAGGSPLHQKGSQLRAASRQAMQEPRQLQSAVQSGDLKTDHMISNAK